MSAKEAGGERKETGEGGIQKVKNLVIVNLNFISTIFGFMPSFLATFIVIVNLLQSNKFFIFLFISICFIMQLIVDFLFYKKNHNEKIFFFRVRLPITIILIINISYLTFV